MQSRYQHWSTVSKSETFASCGHDLTRMTSRRVHFAINELIISVRHALTTFLSSDYGPSCQRQTRVSVLLRRQCQIIIVACTLIQYVLGQASGTTTVLTGGRWIDKRIFVCQAYRVFLLKYKCGNRKAMQLVFIERSPFYRRVISYNKISI